MPFITGIFFLKPFPKKYASSLFLVGLGMGRGMAAN